MRKFYIYLLVISIATVICGVFTWANKDAFLQFPWKKDFSFDYLSLATADANNYYLIDRSLKRLSKVNTAGELQYIIKATDSTSNLHLLNEVVADANGSFYVLNTYLDSRGFYVEGEEIAKYNAEGKVDKVMYRKDYGRINRPEWVGRVKSLKINNGFLYFFSVNDRDVSLKRVTLDGESAEDVFKFQLPHDTYLSEIAGTAAGSIFYTTKKGRIYWVDASGKSIQIFAGDNRSLPINLDVDSNNCLYFADMGNKKILYLNPDTEKVTASTVSTKDPAPKTILSANKLSQQGFDLPFSLINSVRVNQDGSMVIAASDHAISITPTGKVNSALGNATYPGHMLAYNWFVWLQPLLILVLLTLAMKIIYFNIMARSIPIVVKQIIVFVPLMVISMAIVSIISYNTLSDTIEKETFSKLKLLSHLGTQVIDGDRLEGINGPGDFMNSDYRSLQQEIDVMLKEKTWNSEAKYYTVVYKVDKDNLFVALTDDNSRSPYYPYEWDEAFTGVLDGKIITGQESDPDGSWMYAIGPVYNSAGEIVGEFETGIDQKGFNEQRRALLSKLGRSITIMALIVAAVFMAMSYFLLSGIRTLRKGVNNVARGNWDTKVSVRTKDEVADLCQSFNTMSEYILRYINKITLLNESYFRFVPQQFLKFLQKENITEVELGDQVKQEMVILISNIHSFDTISKEISPEESFKIINGFLNEVGPIIRENDGFINKYTGAGIIALFPGETRDALTAAIAMQRQVEHYNSERINSGYQPIEIGIAVHKGPVMLGIVGEEKRMEGTVISDNVNLTETLEKITHKFSASILLTEDVYMDIFNWESYRCRLLGSIEVENKALPVTVYDVFQGEPEHARKLKQETSDLFEDGVILYQDGRFYDARTKFVEVIRRNSRDEAAKLYFFLCDEYFKGGTPEHWSGTIGT
ncbi:MAG: HAMP domain-containing protein [Firmicutes bacterium]|nr:HAMP domain-containing protein [Bacillota bacterium]